MDVTNAGSYIQLSVAVEESVPLVASRSEDLKNSGEEVMFRQIPNPELEYGWNVRGQSSAGENSITDKDGI